MLNSGCSKYTRVCMFVYVAGVCMHVSRFICVCVHVCVFMYNKHKQVVLNALMKYMSVSTFMLMIEQSY